MTARMREYLKEDIIEHLKNNELLKGLGEWKSINNSLNEWGYYINGELSHTVYVNFDATFYPQVEELDFVMYTNGVEKKINYPVCSEKDSRLFRKIGNVKVIKY